MIIDVTYLSQERYDELSNELVVLKKKGRKDIAERLKQAKEMGDLSENSEYQEAREEQNVLEQKINQIEETLRSASIIKKSLGTATVRIGSRVKIKKNGDFFAYTIVGSSEAKPLTGLISNESPMGKELLGKKAGDVVKVKTPKGEVVYEVVGIE